MKSCLMVWVVFLVFSLPVIGQSSIYWVQFRDKKNSPYSIYQPEKYLSERAIDRRNLKQIVIDSTDLPVNPVYADSLRTLGLSIKYTSRWMNGVVVLIPDQLSVDSLKWPSFVQGVELRKPTVIYKSANRKFDATDSLAIRFYGNSYAQVSMMNGHILHQYSKGKGVHIAILDGGFSNANVHPAFDSLYARKGVLGTRDFVEPGNNVYKEHVHGTSVLSTMAGNWPGELYGTAPEASYWLLRTEDVNSEYPVEEDYWIIGAEFADSVGCDVINSSLGYYNFDDPTMDHAYDLFDGHTLRISKAANLAVEKGILVVSSAGNEGNNSWKRIVAPAEAEKVIAVAAVDNQKVVTGFSSRGFGLDHLPLKPDVSAMGSGVRVANGSGTLSYSSGTSFSSPLMAGLSACLIALQPDVKTSKMADLIRSYANRYPVHDSLYGYGITDFSRLYNEAVKAGADLLGQNLFSVYPNPFDTRLVFDVPAGSGLLIIYRFDGKQVYQKTLNYSHQFTILSKDIIDLPKGVYFAVLKQPQQSKTIKLIKQ